MIGQIVVFIIQYDGKNHQNKENKRLIVLSMSLLNMLNNFIKTYAAKFLIKKSIKRPRNATRKEKLSIPKR